jgi:hypothetical protein
VPGHPGQRPGVPGQAGQTGQRPGVPGQTGQRPGVPGQPRPAVPGQPADLATRVDGQRGWLNEIDRSLKKRSIIALVLTCLAVGVGAAAMYIAITKNSDGDRITALESRISALEAATGATTLDPSAVPPPSGTTLPDTSIPDSTVPDVGATGPTLPGE